MISNTCAYKLCPHIHKHDHLIEIGKGFVFFRPKFETNTLSYYFLNHFGDPHVNFRFQQWVQNFLSLLRFTTTLIKIKIKIVYPFSTPPALPAPIYQSLWPGLINIQWRSWFQRWKEYSWRWWSCWKYWDWNCFICRCWTWSRTGWSLSTRRSTSSSTASTASLLLLYWLPSHCQRHHSPGILRTSL